MRKLVARFLADQSGATAIEYCIIAAGISIVIVTVVQGIGTNDDSGWIVSGPVHPVPEPMNLGLFGLGALLVGLTAILRRH